MKVEGLDGADGFGGGVGSLEGGGEGDGVEGVGGGVAEVGGGVEVIGT